MESLLEEGLGSADNIQNERLKALINAMLGFVRFSLAELIIGDSREHRQK